MEKGKGNKENGIYSLQKIKRAVNQLSSLPRRSTRPKGGGGGFLLATGENILVVIETLYRLIVVLFLLTTPPAAPSR